MNDRILSSLNYGVTEELSGEDKGSGGAMWLLVTSLIYLMGNLGQTRKSPRKLPAACGGLYKALACASGRAGGEGQGLCSHRACL